MPFDVFGLIHCYFFGRRVLDVSDSTVGEVVPLNFEFSKHFLDLAKDKQG